MAVPTNWREACTAMGSDTLTIDQLAERLGMNYGRAYERIKALVRDGVAEVVFKGGANGPSRYRLTVPVDRAIAVMTPEPEEMQTWDVVALEQAWPARISRGDVYEQVDADYQQSGQEAVCS